MRRWYLKNKQRLLHKQKAYHAVNSNWRNKVSKAHYYLVKYGFSLADITKRRHAQKNRCVICRGKPGGRHGQLEQDHNHITKQNRGLLCHRCNVVLGLVHEDKKLLAGMSGYLKQWE